MTDKTRTHITVRPRDLAKIDKAAARAGQDRSSFIVDAVLEVIEDRTERMSRKDVGSAFRAIADALESD